MFSAFEQPLGTRELLCNLRRTTVDLITNLSAILLICFLRGIALRKFKYVLKNQDLLCNTETPADSAGVSVTSEEKPKGFHYNRYVSV